MADNGLIVQSGRADTQNIEHENVFRRGIKESPKAKMLAGHRMWLATLQHEYPIVTAGPICLKIDGLICPDCRDKMSKICRAILSRSEQDKKRERHQVVSPRQNPTRRSGRSPALPYPPLWEKALSEQSPHFRAQFVPFCHQ